MLTNLRKIIFSIVLVLISANVLLASEISLASRADSKMIDFAIARLEKVLSAQNNFLKRLDLESSKNAQIIVAVGAKEIKKTSAKNFPNLAAEGFSFSRKNGRFYIAANDERGAMYGVLELADELRTGKKLTEIEAKTVNPTVAFRAIKFNLPFAAYRTGESIEQHQATVKNLKFWEKFLDMMAENRFNALTLWSLHPFPFMVRPTNFPEAASFSESEIKEWKTLWTGIFRMAKERGIETYLVNWNIFTSPEFAEKYNIAKWSNGWKHFGPGATSETLEKYTREIIAQTLTEYPDLTGLGITLGERMGGMSPDERRAWLERTVLQGIRDAKRPVKFIYRSPLSADKNSGGTTSEENDRKTREQIESLGGNFQAPILVEFKYNWSHGHSSPKLFIVHGGKLSDAYFNPAPKNYKVVWTVRNEDFYVLRWGEPDFVREFLSNNTPDYVGGVIVGSEVFIPAKDYVSKDGGQKNWEYDFERKWLFYAVWGRLLFDKKTPDANFAALLEEKFGLKKASDLLNAWKLASRMPLKFASFWQGRADGTLYAEGMTTWADRKNLNFIDINRLIDHQVLDTQLVNIADFVKAGNKVEKGKISPLDLASEIENNASKIEKLLSEIKKREKISPELEAELADIEAWHWFGKYFAAKLRGGVALQNFRVENDKNEQAKAVKFLEDALDFLKKYAATIGRFNKKEFVFHTEEPMSWEFLTAGAERDVEIARRNLKEEK